MNQSHRFNFRRLARLAAGAAGLAGLLATPTAVRAQFTTPHVINVTGDVTNTLGSTLFINHGLVGVGHISASQVDSFGETFGSASSLQVTGWTNNGNGTYSGTLNVLPDRGYNSGNFFADYAARINQVGFTFTPYSGTSNIGGTTDLEKLNAQSQISFTTPIAGVKFTYDDPNTLQTSFTTGLDPGTNSTTLFGQTMPYVTSYTGAQSPTATSNTTYTGINRLPLDSEALIIKPDGSGYIGDEYGADIYYFNPAKKIIGAIVPPPAFQPQSPIGVPNFSSVNPPLNGRRNNQGFEGVSLSPDGTRLFALLQTACVQDSVQSVNDQNAKNTRLLIYDVSANATPASPIAEYVLTLPTYTGNGKGGAVNKTCAQSEVVALDNTRFLVLPRDGNGLGNSSPNPNVYKSFLLVDTAVGNPSNIVGDAARNAVGGIITSNGVPGVLDPTITPLSAVEVVNMLNASQLGKFNIQVDTGTNQVSKLTMGEKWEGATLVPANDPANPNDYFLFVGNDNDFLTSSGKMVGPDGTIITYNGFNGYPANRIPAPVDSTNNENDTRILAFRVTVAPVPNALAAIDHFIVIYQENWSFDSLYAYFPGANGLANAGATSLTQLDRFSPFPPLSTLTTYDPVSSAIPTQNPPVPLNGVQDPRFLSNPSNTNSPSLVNSLLPYNLMTILTPGDITGDIVHRYWQEQHQIDHGAMDKFVTWSDNPGLVMSYFDATPLPEGVLAQQYVMCDNLYHSAFGGSFLNHQFLVAAQAPVYPNAVTIIPGNVALLDPNGQLSLSPATGRLARDGNITPIGGVSFVNTNVTFDKNYAVNTIFSANLQSHGSSPTATSLLPSQNDTTPGDPSRPYIPTIGDLLDTANVSWKWYSGGWNNALDSSPSNPKTLGVPNTVDPLFQWHHQPFAFFDKYRPFDASQPDGRNPVSAAHLQDEANFFTDVANTNLPTVVFVKALGPNNEHPGYASLLQGQQHVASLVAAVQANPTLWAHTAILVTYDEHGGRWDHVTPPVRDIWGPGSRVPGIIISPLSKTNYVDHTRYETVSYLKTIEQRFGLPSLTSVDAAAASLAPAFNAALAAIPSSVQVTRGAFIFDRRTSLYSQQVQLTNAGATPVPAPLLLALDGLSANATLSGPTGTTVNLAPLGSPYVSVPVGGALLAPGQTVSVTLVFINPTREAINYTARVLAGVPTP